MSEDRFSSRYGHSTIDHEVRIRDDAPSEVRQGVLAIAEGELGIRPSVLRKVLCAVLRRLPDPSNWSDYPNVWWECQDLLMNAPWYRVYDFVEELYARLNRSRQDSDLAERWAGLINDFFVESGVGWRLVDGLLESRGTKAFQETIDNARVSHGVQGHETARREIDEAMRDLSRRPQPDLTGAIQHAMAALECTAREITGDRRATLGEILKKHGDLLPKPLDQAISKMWGYASETGRHLQEGRTPGHREVELVVSVAVAASSYLVSQTRTDV